MLSLIQLAQVQVAVKMQQHRPDSTLHKSECNPYKNLATCSEPSCCTFFQLPAISGQRIKMGFVSGHYLQWQPTDTFHFLACSLFYSTGSSVSNSIIFHYFCHIKKYFLLIFFHLLYDSQDGPNSCIVRLCECLLLVYLSTPFIALKIFLVLLSIITLLGQQF